MRHGGSSLKKMAFPPTHRSPELYSRGSSSHSNRIEHLPLSGVLLKCDAYGSDDSKNVIVMKTPRKYTEKEEINSFISEYTENAKIDIAACTIQKFWRRVVYMRKLRHFLDTLFKIKNNFIKVYYGYWRLALRIPANKAQPHYQNIYQHMIKTGSLDNNAQQFLKCEQKNLATFNTYCKTNTILFDKEIDQSKIINFFKISMYFKMKDMISDWEEIATDNAVLKRASPDIYRLAQQREIFGGELWAFHVWFRYTKLKRNPRFLSVYEHRVYIPEWSLFKAKLKTKARKERNADLYLRRCLIRRGLSALNNAAVASKVARDYLEKLDRQAMKRVMRRCVRALQTTTKLSRFDKNVKRRLMYNWYSLVDSSRIRDATLSLYNQRKKLISLQLTLKKWRQNTISERARFVLVTNAVIKSKTLALRFIYLVTNNFIEFTYVSAFHLWKKMIIKKKRARQLIEWSLNHASTDALKQFGLNCFITNNIKDTEKLDHNFRPFIVKETSQARIKSQASLWKMLSMKKICVFSSAVTTTREAHFRISNYEPSNRKVTDLTSSQVRTLLYRLIILKGKRIPLKDKPKRSIYDMLRMFGIEGPNDVKSAVGEIDFRTRSLKYEMRAITNQHNLEILRYESHKAAEQLAASNPNFKLIGSETPPKPRITRRKPKKQQSSFAFARPQSSRKKAPTRARTTMTLFPTEVPSAKITPHPTPDSSLNSKPSKEVLSKPEVEEEDYSEGVELIPKRPPETPPLLHDLKDIISDLRKNQRYYRRAPDDAFREKPKLSQNASSTLLESTLGRGKYKQHPSTYEKFKMSIDPTLFGDRDFSIPEIDEIKRKASFTIEDLSSENAFRFRRTSLNQISLNRPPTIPKPMPVFAQQTMQQRDVSGELERLEPLWFGTPLKTENVSGLTRRYFNVLSALLKLDDLFGIQKTLVEIGYPMSFLTERQMQKDSIRRQHSVKRSKSLFSSGGSKKSSSGSLMELLENQKDEEVEGESKNISLSEQKHSVRFDPIIPLTSGIELIKERHPGETKPKAEAHNQNENENNKEPKTKESLSLLKIPEKQSELIRTARPKSAVSVADKVAKRVLLSQSPRKKAKPKLIKPIEEKPKEPEIERMKTYSEVAEGISDSVSEIRVMLGSYLERVGRCNPNIEMDREPVERIVREFNERQKAKAAEKSEEEKMKKEAEEKVTKRKKKGTPKGKKPIKKKTKVEVRVELEDPIKKEDIEYFIFISPFVFPPGFFDPFFSAK